jgi:hypothetical protein
MEPEKKVIRIDDCDFDAFWDAIEEPRTKEKQPVIAGIYQKKIESTAIATTATNTRIMDEDTIINNCNAVINKLYDSIDLFGIFAAKLTEEDCFEIINIAHYSLTVDSIIKLKLKNKYYSEALEYFITLARKNIDNAIIYTFKTILEPQLPQSIPQLDKLPELIKKLVMDMAACRIMRPYNIVLTGHTDIINCFDICENTHHAATSSKDKTLRLWDLKTGKLIRIFDGKNNTADCLQFNADGSLLVTALNNKNKKCCKLKIWDPQANKKLYTVQINTPIHVLRNGMYNNIFMATNNYDLDVHTMFRATQKDLNLRVDTLAIDRNNVNVLGTIMLSYRYNEGSCNNKIWDTYKVSTKPSETLTITKNCPLIYLYEKVVENTPGISKKQLAKTSLFTQLTELEKNKINKLLIAKQQHNNKLLTNK